MRLADVATHLPLCVAGAACLAILPPCPQARAQTQVSAQAQTQVQTQAQTQVQTQVQMQAQASPLQATLQHLAADHRGKVALFATRLESSGADRIIALNADQPVQTASVIKLAILYQAMAEIRAGRARWDEPITLKPGEAVGGSGMLHFFDTPLQLTLKDVLTMMVVVSDNTATNLAIDRFGIAAVDAKLEQLGLHNTHLYKKVFKPAEGPLPADQPRFGLGKTTAREMAFLMERIGRCGLRLTPARGTAPPDTAYDQGLTLPMDEQDRQVCAVGLDMLKNQFYRETIPRYLETADTTEDVHGIAIASKTGSLDAVRNDVALVVGKSGPMVLSIFTFENEDHSWTVDNAGEVLIAKLAREIVKTWSPAGLDGALLVPGLGLKAQQQ